MKIGLMRPEEAAFHGLFNDPRCSAAITTLDGGKAFIEALAEHDCVFHLEDDPASIIAGDTGGMLFDEMQSAHMRNQVAALYALDWATAGEECPIGYMLAVLSRNEQQHGD